MHTLPDSQEYDTLQPQKDTINVLLIDDDPEDVFVFSKLLPRSRQFEFAVKTCRTLDSASALLESNSFDVIYVDYWLGFETSIPFILDARNRDWPPLILVTGLDTPDIRRCAYRAGVAGYLAKDALSIQAIESVTLAILQRKSATH